MLINLSELFVVEGKEKTYSILFEADEVNVGDANYPVTKKTPVSLQIKNIGERTLFLTGHMEIDLELSCGRCLEAVGESFSLEFERSMDMKLSLRERQQALDEQPYLKGYELDVDQLVCNELLLNLPMKVLCDENCKGICNRCGTNLNYETCDCDNSSLDPRMSVIQNIFKQSKEV